MSWRDASSRGASDGALSKCLLGQAAHLSADLPGALDYFTAVRDGVGDWGPSRVLAEDLAGRASYA